MKEETKHWAGPSVPLDPSQLVVRDAICQLAKIYGLGIDVRDYELCRSAFSEDAVGVGAQGDEPLDTFLRRTYDVGASFHATQHIIANQYVQLRGDEATLWSYGIAHHKVAPGEARDEIIAGVQYRDECRNTGKGWLIVRRQVALQWMDRGKPKGSA
jgi:hypothetical protein